MLYPLLPKNVKVYYLGTGNSFEIQTLLPSIDYTTLTEDNFIVGVSKANSIGTSDSNYSDHAVANASGFSVSKSYDTSTGILSISGNSQTIYLSRINSSDQEAAQTQWQSMTAFVYLVIGEIITV